MRTVLVGAGAIAREHLACLATLRGVEVAAVSDLSAATAEATAELFGIARWSTDYRALLDEIQPDVVHVTTPPRAHFQVATDALRGGAHVIVEKPATTTKTELTDLVAMARSCDRVLVEDYNYVFNAPVQKTLTRIADGSFGEVVHVEVEICLDILDASSPFLDPHAPAGVVDMPGGAIADFLPHLASLAHAFIGPHRQVSTIWQKRDSAHALPADEFRALIDGEQATALVSFSSHSRPDAFWLRVYGTRMRAVMNLFEPRYTVERMWSLPRPLLPVVNGSVEAWGVAHSAMGGLMSKLSGGPRAFEGLWTLLTRTYASLDHGSAPPVSLTQIEQVNRLIDDLVDADRRL